MQWDELLAYEASGDIIVYALHKYRCEQTVTTYLNGVPASNVQTKSDYSIQGIEDRSGHLAYRVQVDENIVSMFPAQFNEAAEMMSDVESVKSDVILAVDSLTGKPIRILNHDEITGKWEDYKHGMRERYEFLQDRQTMDALEDFLGIIGKQIADKDALLSELRMKLPFFLVFDRYLVSPGISAGTERQDFSSPLFDHVTFPIDVNQEIEKETPTEILLSRHSSPVVLSAEMADRIRKTYDQRYKPAVGYSFSTYGVDYDVRLLLDREGRFIREAQGSIVEEVANNVRLNISFTLRDIQ